MSVGGPRAAGRRSLAVCPRRGWRKRAAGRKPTTRTGGGGARSDTAAVRKRWKCRSPSRARATLGRPSGAAPRRWPAAFRSPRSRLLRGARADGRRSHDNAPPDARTVASYRPERRGGVRRRAAHEYRRLPRAPSPRRFERSSGERRAVERRAVRMRGSVPPLEARCTRVCVRHRVTARGPPATS